jgi:hypothetical protein
MDDNICLLITILYEDQLLKCALKVNQKHLTNDVIEYPMVPENREVIHNLLPSHIRLCGPIVDIEFLFEIHIVEE